MSSTREQHTAREAVAMKEDDSSLFYGALNWIQQSEEGDELDQFEIPIGVGTQDQLVIWTSRMRGHEELFKEHLAVAAVWIELLPTAAGRIPWENSDEFPDRILLLEGDIPVDVLADMDVDVEIVRVTPPPSQ